MCVRVHVCVISRCTFPSIFVVYITVDLLVLGKFTVGTMYGPYVYNQERRKQGQGQGGQPPHLWGSCNITTTG